MPLLHYLKDYSDDIPTFIKKTAKYVARLCHAHDLIKDEGKANLNKLLGIEGKGINKKELLQVGDYQNIIDKHKDGKRNEDGKEIQIDNDPYNSLTTSDGNITNFIKEMYKKVKTCLETAEVVAK